MSLATTQKATRLLAEGRVHELPQQATVFTVEGDQGQYITVVSATVAVCTCPATARCSHLEAAVAWINATDTERALMQRCRDQRIAEQADLAEDAFRKAGA